MDKLSLSHCCYVCTYHIVFIPKYRRRIIYGTLKKDIVEILKKLLEMKGVVLIEGKLCKDHVHLYVSIPPKIPISEVVGYVKGKSALMIFDRHPEYREKYGGRHFWARGYYVATVGNGNGIPESFNGRKYRQRSSLASISQNRHYSGILANSIMCIKFGVFPQIKSVRM